MNTNLDFNNDLFLKMSTALRCLCVDSVQNAKSGHPGMPMGMADVATVLFAKHLKYCPDDPLWPNRDRFILSAGHGSVLLYSLLHLTGYKAMTLEQLKNFRQIGSITPGHPEYDPEVGVELTTGPLGQGIGMAVGMALAERILAADFGGDLVDNYTYVIVGDGCLMEGISQEAISFAGKMKLGKLIVIWDNNGITIDGNLSMSDSTNQKERFSSVNWKVIEANGHDCNDIDRAFTEAKSDSDRPVFIDFKTVIGFGSPNKAGSADCHGSPLGEDEISEFKKQFNWPYAPFDIPEDIRSIWVNIGERSKGDYEQWQGVFSRLSKKRQNDFNSVIKGHVPVSVNKAFKSLNQNLCKEMPKLATRKSSENVIKAIYPNIDCMVGGSADLTGSNLTKVSQMKVIEAPDYKGRYIHYGIREHLMAAAMNGMVAYGCGKVYGGTFLAFSDYMRPSIRLSALMGLPVIYVMTHDSIGLGEDGPTHQPVEHLSILRSTPNLLVFRPADAIETSECWQCALQLDRTPSVLVLSRQSVPAIRNAVTSRNLCSLGGYIVNKAVNKRKATLIAMGSELHIALDAAKILESKGIGVQVVSVPCLELFMQQPESYKRRVLPSGGVRILIEAAVVHGWEGLLYGFGGNYKKSAFIGMSSYGESAPYNELYSHFGINAEEAVKKVEALLA